MKRSSNLSDTVENTCILYVQLLRAYGWTVLTKLLKFKNYFFKYLNTSNKLHVHKSFILKILTCRWCSGLVQSLWIFNSGTIASSNPTPTTGYILTFGNFLQNFLFTKLLLYLCSSILIKSFYSYWCYITVMVCHERLFN